MTPVPAYDVVILCGGLGTRLRSVVSDRPKSMALIHGRPFLDLLVDQIVGYGFRRVILCVGYRAEFIKTHFAARTDCEMLFSEEPKSLGTAGALRLAVPLLKTPTVLVLNGDSYCSIDAAALIDFHRRKKAIGTLILLPAAEGRAGGVVTVDEHDRDRVTEFVEKPAPGVSGHFNAGIYVFERRAFDAIPEATACSLEMDVLPSLRPHLYGFHMKAPLYDIGTPDGLHAFTDFYGRSRARSQHEISPVRATSMPGASDLQRHLGPLHETRR
jgi:NDP-sugar pyrophosphorylase family protein